MDGLEPETTTQTSRIILKIERIFLWKQLITKTKMQWQLYV